MAMYFTVTATNLLSYDGQIERHCRLYLRVPGAADPEVRMTVANPAWLAHGTWVSDLFEAPSSMSDARQLVGYLPPLVHDAEALGARLLAELLTTRCPADSFMTEFTARLELGQPLRLTEARLRVYKADTSGLHEPDVQPLWTWLYQPKDNYSSIYLLSAERSDLARRSAWRFELEELEGKYEASADALFGQAHARLGR
jgi:hypothetical protein